MDAGDLGDAAAGERFDAADVLGGEVEDAGELGGVVGHGAKTTERQSSRAAGVVDGEL